MKGAAALVLALLLAGCAHAPPARQDSVGAGVAGLPAPEAGEVLTGLRKALEAQLSLEPPDLSLGPAAGDTLRISMPAAPRFDAGSAQLKPEALGTYARLAAAFKQYPQTVVHLLVCEDPAAAPEEPSLAERRAAALAAYLDEQGLGGARLRAHSRAGAACAGQLLILLRPVVQGQEPLAWTLPPEVTGS